MGKMKPRGPARLQWNRHRHREAVTGTVVPPLKKKQECQAIVDGLRDTLDVRDATIESLQKVLGETEMLCSSLKKQMKFLEQQQEDKRSSKEEACRLRNKLKTMERIELLLQSQRPEVEEMIREMGVGQAAVEQLAVYCVSLKKEYENLKEARKVSSEMTEKLKKELFAANSKLQRTVSDLENTKEDQTSAQMWTQNGEDETAGPRAAAMEPAPAPGGGYRYVVPPLKKKQECQAIVDGLRDTLDVRDATIESLQKVLGETEMLCSSLKKQMKFLEQQQEDKRSSKEEACRLRNKLKTMERIELLLQSQRPEVEEMIREMGVGQAAVEQLAVYCVSLKKEYENLKEARKVSSEMTEKLKKELFAANSKLQRTVSDLENTKEELESTQKDLKNADKEILSLKKTIDILQDTLKVPSVTRETLSRLVSESPAPVELRHPKLHCPAHSDEINLDATFDVDTPVVVLPCWAAKPHNRSLTPPPLDEEGEK
eukprot:XP_027312098.1 myosin heavy chain, clone 203-like [Anas platyrhynchos]